MKEEKMSQEFIDIWKYAVQAVVAKEQERNPQFVLDYNSPAAVDALWHIVQYNLLYKEDPHNGHIFFEPTLEEARGMSLSFSPAGSQSVESLGSGRIEVLLDGLRAGLQARRDVMIAESAFDLAQNQGPV